MSFFFGQTPTLTPDGARRKRELAAQFASQIGGARNVGEGLSAIGSALASRGLQRQADKADAENNKKAYDLIAAAMRGEAPSFGTFDSSQTSGFGAPIDTSRTPEQEIGDNAMAALSRTDGMSMPGLFDSLEERHGLPEGYLARTAQIESGGNPNAQNPNSSAGGMFQFIDSTAQQYGLTDKTDPHASARAAAQLAADNAGHLRQVLGREPTAGELYLAHQQGAGGAAKLLSNPNASAASVVGNQAVSLNGGNANMTAGDFANQWTGKFGGGQAQPAQPPQQDYSAFYEALASPWLDQGQKAILMSELRDRKAADQRAYDQWTQANDPMRQLQLERAQLEVEALRNPTEDKTTLMRNYDAAVAGGYQGDIVQYQTDIKKAGATQNNISVGGDAAIPDYPKAPAGYMYVRDPVTGQVDLNDQGIAQMAPIVGGPEDTSKQDAVARENTSRSGDVVIEDIDRVLAMANDGGLPTSGGVGGFLSKIPGTDAHNTGKLLETIKANVGFDRLQQMRDASKTGGALGAINQTEMGLLTSALGSLEQSQSKEQFEHNLNRLRSIYMEIVHGPQQTGGAGPQVGVVEDGYRFKGGNPADPNSWEPVN